MDPGDETGHGLVPEKKQKLLVADDECQQLQVLAKLTQAAAAVLYHWRVAGKCQGGCIWEPACGGAEAQQEQPEQLLQQLPQQVFGQHLRGELLWGQMRQQGLVV